MKNPSVLVERPLRHHAIDGHIRHIKEVHIQTRVQQGHERSTRLVVSK